jgi:hypothetical protein
VISWKNICWSMKPRSDGSSVGQDPDTPRDRLSHVANQSVKNITKVSTF